MLIFLSLDLFLVVSFELIYLFSFRTLNLYFSLLYPVTFTAMRETFNAIFLSFLRCLFFIIMTLILHTHCSFLIFPVKEGYSRHCYQYYGNHQC